MDIKNNISLFILEDDPFYQTFVENELVQMGFSNIEKFNEGEELINNLFKMPDIIVLDYHLEGHINGVEVLRKIKSFNPDIPVIMLSAQDKLEVAVHTLKYGAFDYVMKGDQASEKLEGVINRILDWKQLENESHKAKRARSLFMYGVATIIAIATVWGVLA